MALSMPCGSASGQRPIPAMAGIGLHPVHHFLVLRERPKAAWLEVRAENFMSRGVLRADLELIARHYPLSIHAVGLSLGSIGLPDSEHLGQLRELVEHLQPDLISDHLSWSAVDGVHFPDLLPLPYTEEALEVVIRNVLHVQNCLGRPLLLENPSTYLELPQSALTEAEFLAEVTLRTGCGVLLDLNNLFVSAGNRGSDAGKELQHFLEALPEEAICEIHLGGRRRVDSTSRSAFRIGDQGSPVCPAVWDLYATAIQELGPLPTLIEWDTLIPPFQTLQAEAETAQSLLDESLREERRRANAG
jgi:uncharacterized protein